MWSFLDYSGEIIQTVPMTDHHTALIWKMKYMAECFGYTGVEAAF